MPHALTKAWLEPLVEIICPLQTERVTGSVALILHAHLPFVRHPEHEAFLEEEWLFEAITESYVPLLRMLLRLGEEAVPVRLGFSVTPTLCAMLQDPLLLRRYLKHLDELIGLADRECCRNRSNAALSRLARFYRHFFSETRRTFCDEWNCDLLGVLRQLRASGLIEIIASAATHGLLPLLDQTPGAARAQVALGCDRYRDVFGGELRGFWLPECAYAPGIDQLLAEEDIRWFIVDGHALTHARPPARRGTFAPCYTPAGPAAFARDARASRQVWSAQSGYPGHPIYREFYRDIGFDLPAAELPGSRKFTGLKYYRITGNDEAKDFYDPARAEEVARQHALDFVAQRIADLDSVSADNFVPIVTVPFDAELFGHWWFEGPVFLEHVLRNIAARTHEIALTTPGEFLANNPAQQVVTPSASSWGDKGFLDVWLDPKSSWVYPHLLAAARQMAKLAQKHEANVNAQTERALRQLGRELLLAQSSDWPFLIRNETARHYATQRMNDHLQRFARLAASLENGRVDPAFLAECEERDNLFPNLNWRHFAHFIIPSAAK